MTIGWRPCGGASAPYLGAVIVEVDLKGRTGSTVGLDRSGRVARRVLYRRRLQTLAAPVGEMSDAESETSGSAERLNKADSWRVATDLNSDFLREASATPTI